MPRFAAVALATAVVIFIPCSVQGANLILNPGFEEPDIGSGTFAVFQSIPGWTKTTGHSIEIQDNIVGSPFEGHQHVELDSFANSGMSQTITTVPGASYSLQFAYSPRPGRPLGDNIIEVYFDGTLVDTLDGVGGANTMWAVKQYVITATTAASVLEFRAGGPSNTWGGYLDDVQFNAVNQPPDCSASRPSLDALWPPNHKFRDITVEGVTDGDGDSITIRIDSIFQDEAVAGPRLGSGATTPDGDGSGGDTAALRAERNGSLNTPGNGRVYHIDFTAEDGKGGTCSSTVRVCVPHDRRSVPACVDEGPLFDSTTP